MRYYLKNQNKKFNKKFKYKFTVDYNNEDKEEKLIIDDTINTLQTKSADIWDWDGKHLYLNSLNDAYNCRLKLDEILITIEEV